MNIISQSKIKNHLSIITPITILLIDIKIGELLTKGKMIKGLYYLPIQVLYLKERVFTTLHEAIKILKEDQSPQSLQSSKEQKPKSSKDQRPKGSEDQRPKGSEDQRTKGSEDQRPKGSEDQRPKGSEDQRPKGAEDQRTKGSEDQRPKGSEDQRPKGSEDQRPKGSEDQRPKGSKDQTSKGLKNAKVFPKSPCNCKTRKGSLKPKKESLQTLYERFGYISLKALTKIASSNNIRIVRNGFDINQCPICNEAKMLKQRHKVSLSNFKTLDYLEKVSSDICGPISPSTYQGYKYFITFLEKKTRFLKITLLKRKSEALQAFKDYKAEVENNSSGKRIQTFSTDNGTEYVNNDFEITLYEFGIKHSRTAPYTKELNGLIERPNRTFLEKVRSLIYQANLARYL